jgi:hypothetical protein
VKNIQLIHLDKYANNSNYELIEGNIFKDLDDEEYAVFALSYELEDGEDSQYPLEDILDEFYLHVSDFIDEEAFYNNRIVDIELGGKLDNIKTAIDTIVGKRVFNSEYVGDDGRNYLKLTIV